VVAAMHIEILKHPINGTQVRVVDAGGRTLRMFTYPTIECARRTAAAWAVAYNNCRINDKSEMK
jgi:hypothetical protein